MKEGKAGPLLPLPTSTHAHTHTHTHSSRQKIPSSHLVAGKLHLPLDNKQKILLCFPNSSWSELFQFQRKKQSTLKSPGGPLVEDVGRKHSRFSRFSGRRKMEVEAGPQEAWG